MPGGRAPGLSPGFVEALAAQQTLDSPSWFEGTADAVRWICGSLRSGMSMSTSFWRATICNRDDYADFVQRHRETQKPTSPSRSRRAHPTAQWTGLRPAPARPPGAGAGFSELTGAAKDAMRVAEYHAVRPVSGAGPGEADLASLLLDGHSLGFKQVSMRLEPR